MSKDYEITDHVCQEDTPKFAFGCPICKAMITVDLEGHFSDEVNFGDFPELEVECPNCKAEFWADVQGEYIPRYRLNFLTLSKKEQTNDE